jgi:glycosyltransferase involved in cell wall biosynthesis
MKDFGTIKKQSTEKIRILYITSLLDKKGGAEKNLCDIVLNIDKHKFMPYVLAFKGGELTEELETRGINVQVNGVSKLISYNALKKGKDLYYFLKKVKIQVIVTYHHDADIWAGIIARLAGVLVVISSRRDMGYQLAKKHIWFYRIFSHLFSSFITVSEAVGLEISRREWIGQGRIKVIHNGLRTDLYSKKHDLQEVCKKYGISSTKTVIGIVASFRPVKGQMYLVEAINKIVKSYNDIQVVCVGDNETEYFSSVKSRIDELELQKYFLFTGVQQNIPEILSIFDIFVMPSVNEGFSNAIIEAMAAGKPVIAPDSGGNPEAVEHGKSGFLFKPCDSGSLAEALKKLINNKDLCQLMGREGRTRTGQLFTLDKMIGKTENFIQSILDYK